MSMIEIETNQSGEREIKIDFTIISFRISESTLLRTTKYLTALAATFIAFSIFQYVIFFQHCSLSLVHNRGKLSCPTESTILVSPNLGFQYSEAPVEKGDKIRIHVSGSVHVSGYQDDNRARAMRCVIFDYLSEDLRKNYLNGFRSLSNGLSHEPCYDYYARRPDGTSTPSHEWYRHWVDENGERRESDTYFGTKLHPSEWGSLLWVILPKKATNFGDPYHILESNNLKPGDISQVRDGDNIVADRSGYLHFIVNDAIISHKSPSERSKAYYQALERASRDHTKSPQQIEVDRISLYLYSDNRGLFLVNASFE